jgi:hypothetical protein
MSEKVFPVACRACFPVSLPTLDCSVHIEWIDLDAATVPAGALGGKGLPSLI